MRAFLCVCVWSNISMRCGAAGNFWILLRVHPKEQTVCHSTRCSATYSPQTWARLCSCEFMNINSTSKLSQLHSALVIVIYSEMLRPSALNLPLFPGCILHHLDVTSRGQTVDNLPPPPPFTLLAVAHHWSPPLSVGENAPP